MATIINDEIDGRYGEDFPDHVYPNEANGSVDHILNMIFLPNTGSYGPGKDHGTHARLGNGRDIFNFVDVQNVIQGKTITGRLEDFDPTRDKIQIDGRTIDLNNLPDNARVVAYNGNHNDAGADPQQWLLIMTPNRGNVFYALEGARIDMDGNGDSGAQERHFPDLSNGAPLQLAEIEYQNPFNFVPTGYVATDGGVTINDVDGTIADVLTQISGSTGGDLIAGGINGDKIASGSGNDHVWGGDGADSISGDAGEDKLWGNNGADTILGGASVDTIYGGRGNDSVLGGTGGDPIAGEDGNDVLKGETNNDTISGGNGNDLIYGGTENDSLLGQSGNDRIYGDSGNDVLNGGSGDDNLTGGDGDDKLYVGTTSGGGAGSDQLTGGSGSDQFVFGGRIGFAAVTDFEDKIDRVSFAGSNVDSMSDLTITFGNDSVGAYAKISVDTPEGDGGTIRVYGVTAATFTSADFIF